MSVLDQISKPKPRPLAATIIGEAGLGKTSLAACFPKPIFIRAEDGLKSIINSPMPDAFPVLKTVEDLWPQIWALAKEEHSYGTVVIDTVSTLDTMFTDWVVETDPNKPKSINQALGGWGAGTNMVASQHRRLRKGCEYLLDRGMNVVFLSHADTSTISPPDGNQYTRYTMRMHEKSMQPYVDNVDVVGFLRLETFTKGDGDVKKAISTGDRQLVCHAMAANVSKNRFGIVDPIEVKLGENPLREYLIKGEQA
jgi:hypothetical protein